MAEDTQSTAGTAEQKPLPQITITLQVIPGRLTEIKMSAPLDPHYTVGIFTELADAHRKMLTDARVQLQHEMLAKMEAERQSKIGGAGLTQTGPVLVKEKEMSTNEPTPFSPESQSENHPG